VSYIHRIEVYRSLHYLAAIFVLKMP